MRIGCGCWRQPIEEPNRFLYLVRNALLIALALASIPTARPLASATWLALLAGPLLAVLILELPQVLTVALARGSEG